MRCARSSAAKYQGVLGENKKKKTVFYIFICKLNKNIMQDMYLVPWTRENPIPGSVNLEGPVSEK